MIFRLFEIANNPANLKNLHFLLNKQPKTKMRPTKGVLRVHNGLLTGL